MNLVMVAVGGALGAMARYGLSTWLQRRAGGTFPIGTLVVNVVGCLVLGALMALVADRAQFAPRTRLFVGMGLLGSFTTFSTFGFETVELARHGDWHRALANIGLNVLLGLVAVLAGQILVRELID